MTPWEILGLSEGDAEPEALRSARQQRLAEFAAKPQAARWIETAYALLLADPTGADPGGLLDDPWGEWATLLRPPGKPPPPPPTVPDPVPLPDPPAAPRAPAPRSSRRPGWHARAPVHVSPPVEGLLAPTEQERKSLPGVLNWVLIIGTVGSVLAMVGKACTQRDRFPTPEDLRRIRMSPDSEEYQRLSPELRRILDRARRSTEEILEPQRDLPEIDDDLERRIRDWQDSTGKKDR